LVAPFGGRTAGNFRLRQSGEAGTLLRNLRASALLLGMTMQDVEKSGI
jgi:hypothetical protein